MKKKLFTLCLFAIATTHLFANGIEINGIYYLFEGNNASVTCTGYIGSSNYYTGNISIPTTVQYQTKTYNVTSIGDYAFRNCRGLISVTFPKSIITIGEEAFSGCEKLTSLNIPNSVTEIKSGAFSNCKNITFVQLPNSIKTIEDRVFSNCANLDSVDIPNSVTTIGSYAFYYCNKLSYIVLPNSLSSIGELAFLGCTSLKIVANMSSLPIVAKSSDYGYVAYYADVVGKLLDDFIIEQDTILSAYIGNGGDVSIPNTITKINNYAFLRCNNLTSVYIPNSVKEIGEGAFYQCIGLTSLTLPNLPLKMGLIVFAECTNISFVSIPVQLTDLNNAFSQCTGIKSVEWKAINCKNGYFGEQVESFVFGDSVEVIPESICKGMTKLTTINLPESIKKIGNSAFQGCTNLDSITIGKNVTEIGKDAFKSCSNLKTLTINSPQIAEKTYTQNDNLSKLFGYQIKKVTFGNDVTSVGDWAFFDCALNSVVFGEKVSSIGQHAFSSTSIGAIVLPNSVVSIGTSAFASSGLYSIKLSDNLQTIEKYAFSYTKLDSIVIPSSVTSIASSAFTGCSKLKTVTINSNAIVGGQYVGVTKYAILIDVFGSQVTTYILGDDVTAIGDLIFYGPYGSSVTKFVLGKNIKIIGDNAFAYNQLLTSVNIPNSVISIGDGAFAACDRLPVEDNLRYADTYLVEATDVNRSSYIIKDGTRWIGSHAFSDCTKLKSVVIPASVISIGKAVFSPTTYKTDDDCATLTTLVCSASTPPTCVEDAFKRVNKNIPIYVPAQSISLYRVADGWKEFTNFLPIEATDVQIDEQVLTEPTTTGVDISWKKVEGTNTYTIEFKQKGKVVNTFIFDANGVLQNIVYAAPARGGERSSHYATATATGWTYTITGLEAGTEYTYTIIAKDNGGSTLYSKSGTFKTTGSEMAIDEVTDSRKSQVEGQKFIRNGVLYIERNDKTYDAQGRKL